jgi:hypothetical protein
VKPRRGSAGGGMTLFGAGVMSIDHAISFRISAGFRAE